MWFKIVKIFTVEACNNGGYYYTDWLCCKICNRDCKFKITCEARHKDFYISEHTEDDQGWNPVEGKLFLRFNCKKCKQLIKKV